MAKYRVVADKWRAGSPVKMGDVLELTDEEAIPLLSKLERVNDAPPPQAEAQLQPLDMTVEEALAAVAAGTLPADEALARELVGKRRKTLISALEDRLNA